jgi:hypothetical protein
VQGLAAVVVLVGAVTARNITWEPPPTPPIPEARFGIDCYRAGGDHDYCRCLDRLESARAAAHVPTPAFPRLDHPAIRYALRHRERYPVVTADTPRCLRVSTAPPAHGTAA